MQLKNIKISVIGLGYVGLPLALEFSKKYKVVGFDINTNRITSLSNGIDDTKESDSSEILTQLNSKNLLFVSNIDQIKDSNFYDCLVISCFYGISID